jgi:octaprenyl-diphosphate synthase
MNDFVEGKCTLPYIYLYKELDAESKAKLESFHAKKIDAQDTLWIKEQMQKYKSVEKSFELAKKLSNEAMMAIQGDEALIEILQTMIKRSY